MPTTALNGLGQALRWLRDRQGKKQYHVADAAGITKGMLSAYETGRQRPSLDTLEKILDTLGTDLNDLHNALQIVNGRPEGMKRRGDGLDRFESFPPGRSPQLEVGGESVVQQVLGRWEALPPEEEKAFRQMLEGFHRFLRYLHDLLPQEATGGDTPKPPKPTDE
ncbi:MAG TPA: helix-turn-helix transcriptional regulator [Thermoanaerobaculia bacterium]|nr:helix-turn-helix transcriptional regulator [Thermoanaerobaculia bacterium]